ncbi:hypothetical protein D3C75_1120230 [compost metagenome]
MSKARMTSEMGVTPSTSQEFSSRWTICSSTTWVAHSPMTVLIRSFMVTIPTTRAYSFITTAKSPLWFLKYSIAS